MAKKLIETYKAPLTAAQWLTSNLDMHNMTNVALAKELNVVSTLICAWKKGSQNIPLGYCRQLSEIFGADPVYVRNLLLEAKAPGLWHDDEELRLMGGLTKNESEFIKILRENSVANVGMNDEEKEAFRQFVSKLRDSRGLSAQSPDLMVKKCGPGAHKDIYYATTEERMKAEERSIYRAEHGYIRQKGNYLGK